MADTENDEKTIELLPSAAVPNTDAALTRLITPRAMHKYEHSRPVFYFISRH